MKPKYSSYYSVFIIVFILETEGRCSTYRNVTQVYKASSFDFHVQSHGKHDCHMKKKRWKLCYACRQWFKDNDEGLTSLVKELTKLSNKIIMIETVEYIGNK